MFELCRVANEFYISLNCIGQIMEMGSFCRFFVPNQPRSLLLRRRSNSICKSPGPASPREHHTLGRDIGRSESLRSSNSCSHRIFRPCDLIHGEVLGKGFFGRAIKVSISAANPRTIIRFTPALCKLWTHYICFFHAPDR